MRLGTADVLVRAKTDKFDKDIDKSEKKVKSFGQKSKKELVGLTSSFASLAGVAGVGALTVSLVGLVSVGTTFESQMATVKGIMRASEKDFKLLSDAAKKMGEMTEWSATKSGEALEFMALAGWSVEKSIKGLPGMLDAATAAGARLGETSDILTDTLTAMGLKIEDMDRLTDVMVGTTVRANTSFLQMGEALKESAPYAKAYGYEIEEVAALLGVVADAGIKGSDAGTGLKNTWINNAKAAKILGTEATDLIGTLRAANEAQWDTNQFAKVYGKIAGKTVLNIAAQIPKYEALAKTLHNVKGETKKLADIKLDVVAGDFKILKSAIEGVGIAAYESIKGELRESLQDMTEFVSDHKQDFVEFAESAKEIGGHLAVIGGHVASFLGNTLRGWNALPAIVQEMGIVGAVVGGVPGRLALIGTVEILGQAVGYIDELVKSAEGISTVFGKEFKLVENLEGAEKQLAQLEKLRDEFLDLSAVGKKKMGGNVYLERLSEQIDDVEDHIDDLQEKLKATVSEPEKDVEDKKLDEISAKEIPGLTDSEIDKLNERYELEKKINKKIHDETLSYTDRELEELSARYLHYYDYAHDKNALDLWYRTKRDEILEGAPVAPDLTESEQAYMDLYAKTGELTQESYDIRYAQYVKDRDDFIRFTGDKKTAQETFAADINALNEEMIPPEPDLSPMLQAYVDLYDELGIMTQPVYDLMKTQYAEDRDAFIEATGNKLLAAEIFAAKMKKLNADIAKSDEKTTEEKLKTIAEYTGMMASTFETLANIGGKHSKEMFEAYKAFKIAETLIASYSGAMKAYAEGGVYLGPAMAAIILAFGAAQVANIQSQEPPSYDQGGISQAGGIYQTGDIDEAHVPLPSGGKIPVQINNNETVSRHPMSIHIYEAAGTHARTEESDDGMTLDIIIEQVEQKMAGRMNRGAGLASFMDNRYSRTY
jgi:TP901 family phage tail tape measure protein